MSDVTVGVLIPTYNGLEDLKILLPILKTSPLCLKILIIDSSSQDGTADYLSTQNVVFHTIPKKAFQHGKTREWGRKLLGTDIVIFMSQDVFPVSCETLSLLIQPLIENQVDASYARQLPHFHASPLEKEIRAFHYPPLSSIRRRDGQNIGVGFFSHACAAYRNKTLDGMGGVALADFGEDQITVERILDRGGAIAYVAESVVYHSHSFKFFEEWKRAFYVGTFRAKMGSVTSNHSYSAWKLCRKVGRRCFDYPVQNWPRFIFDLCVRGSGYVCGKWWSFSSSSRN